MENKKINPPVQKGDRIVCWMMQDDSAVPSGTEGEVLDVQDDPFETETPNSKIISVKWDDGSTLSILTSVDFYKLAKKKLVESTSLSDFISKNEEIYPFFRWSWWYNYLETLRQSGIINMFGSSPLLYCGAEHLERYYGEDPPDQEKFDELLEMADDARNYMVQGCVEYLESENKDISVESLNSCARKMSQKILEFFISIK